MLIKIADDLYIDLSEILQFEISQAHLQCHWVLKSFPGRCFFGSLETGALIKHKLDWWLGAEHERAS